MILSLSDKNQIVAKTERFDKEALFFKFDACLSLSH